MSEASEFSKYIDKNLQRLISQFSDGDIIIVNLISSGVLGDTEQQELECEKVHNKKAKMLWDKLKKKESQLQNIITAFKNSSCDKNVVKILQDYRRSEHSTDPRSSSTSSTQDVLLHSHVISQKETTFKEFHVHPEHIYEITKVIQNVIRSHSEWEQIMEDLLPNHMVPDVMREQNFGYKIQKTITYWVSASKEEDRLFSKLLTVIKKYDHTRLYELLKEKSVELSSLHISIH